MAGPDTRPYGVAIHQSIAAGDVAEMKQLAEDTEAYLAEVEGALAKLKAEIEKAQG
jgi:hypothetical protein